MPMSDRSYLSIGDVLNLLKDEFPDVTISKIRFLESQGLLDPERTPSGYRKFYDADVERLRWILRQQKDHFLPLKVIKGRLGPEGGVGGPDEGSPGAGSTTGRVEDAGARSPAPAPVVRAGGGTAPNGAGSGTATVSLPAAAPSFPVEPTTTSAPAALAAGPTSVSLTWEELLDASGLEESEARDLERFGLIVGRPVARTAYYDDDALIVARLAAEFRRYGVEARHLRMYKTAAEREAGFFEQVVMPMLKQRNPEARRQASETLAELARLGQQLRSAMLRNALRDYLEE